MQSVNNFFQSIHRDIQLISHMKEQSNLRDEKIASVALRIFGAGILISAAAVLVANVAGVAGSSLAALALLVGTAVMVIIARDCIVIGTNISKAHALLDGFPSNIADMSWGVLDRIKSVANTAYKEWVNGMPYFLEDTWLAAPIFIFFNSNKKED